MTIKEKPKVKTKNPEDFLSSAKAEVDQVEPTKKMVVEIPVSLHKKIRIRAAQEERTIKDVVVGVLKENF